MATNEVPVRREDQEKINDFARLAEQLNGIKPLLADIKSELELLQDVETESMLGEDLRLAAGEANLYRIGDVFISLEDDEFKEAIELEEKRLKTKSDELLKLSSEIEEKQAGLKRALYERFKDQIALDMDE